MKWQYNEILYFMGHVGKLWTISLVDMGGFWYNRAEKVLFLGMQTEKSLGGIDGLLIRRFMKYLILGVKLLWKQMVKHFIEKFVLVKKDPVLAPG